MADKMDIVRSVVTGSVEMPHVASPIAADPQNAETLRKAEELRDLQSRIQFRIAQVNSDNNLSTEDRLALIARLEGALNSGNPDRIIYALNAVALDKNRANDEERSEDAMDEMHLLDPSGYGYDQKSRNYMNKLWREALSKSPELQAMAAEVNALPPAQRALAEEELKNNYATAKEMLGNEAYKPYHEQLEIMRRMGALHSKEAAGILAGIQSGEPVEEITRLVNGVVQKKIDAARPIINGHIAHIPAPSQEFLKSNFGKDDGTIDVEKLMKEWGKTRPKERDEAYKAMVDAGNDINKLSPPHQRIIHMSQVMIAVDGASVAKGTLEIVARNKEAAKYLSDTSIDPKIREQRLAELLKEAGVLPSERAVYQESLEQAIHSLDDMAKKGKTLGAVSTEQFASSFLAEYKENMLEVAGHKPSQADVRRVDNAIDAAQNQSTYGYADSMRFIAAAKADSDIPEWIRKDPVRLAEYEANIAQWKQIDEGLKTSEQQRFAEANAALPDGSAETVEQFMARYNAAQQAGASVTIIPPTPIPDTPASPTLGAQASEVVATVVSPPPGIDPKTLPPLTLLGVTGGDEVVQAAQPTGGKAPQQGIDGPAH
jgi:hypothetical protein